MTDKPPSAWQLERVISLAQETLTKLREEDGVVMDSDEELLGALHEEGVTVDKLLRRLGRSYLDDKAMTAVGELRMADLKARQERNFRGQTRKRALIQAVMEAIGVRRFPDPEFDLSLKEGDASVHVPIVDDLADEFVEVKVSKTAKKAEIKTAIRAGREVTGAYLSNAPTILTIRSK